MALNGTSAGVAAYGVFADVVFGGIVTMTSVLVNIGSAWALARAPKI